MDKQNDFCFWNYGEPIIPDSILNVVLLAHVQKPRGYINPTQLQCSDTERFSIEEFNEIYQGIVNAGYYIQAVYYNECDFIEDYLRFPNRFRNCLIYCLSRNGIGDNKKTIIPAFCELVGLNYSCSSSLSCALCRNKYYFTTLFLSHGIPAPKSWLLTEDGTWLNNSPPDGTRVICKPCSESASQGINDSGIVLASANSFSKLAKANYIVQEYIEGEECEVPMLKVGNSIKALSPIGIDLGSHRILDEKTSEEYKYTFYNLHDTQDENTINAIKQCAEKAFRLMKMEVYGRIDFRISPSGDLYIFDVSTTPYTIHHSSYAFAFKQMGLQYSDIYQAIISAALRRPGATNQNDKN